MHAHFSQIEPIMSIVVKDKNESLEVPPDYVKCSKKEAVQHQMSIISDWYPKSDAWPFHYGPMVLSVLGAVTGGVITSILRKRLKLQHYGRVAMLLPAMGIPGTFGPLFHYTLVTEPLVIQSECPVCLQMRAILIQNAMGVGYPIVMSSATGLFLAEKYATYRLPEFSFRALPKFVNIARGMLTPSSNKILGLAIVSTLVAGFITDRQAKSLFTISQKLQEDVESQS